MRKPKMFLLLSEIWSMTDGRDLLRVVELAVEAERAGFDGVMVGEHVVSGANSAKNGTPANRRDWLRVGNQPPMYSHPSSLHLLAAIAARTTNLRLLAAALITPLRHPLTIAKEMATVDLISRGRLTVLPSVSWQNEEYQALGVLFHKRGKILDEQLAIWQKLWTDGSPVSHDGEMFQFEKAYVEPTPYRRGGPPLWFGGRGLQPHLLRRAVRYGQGYWPVVPLTDGETAQLRSALAAAGRSIDDFEIGAMLSGLPFKGTDDLLDLDEALAPVRTLWDRGVSAFLIKPSLFMDDDAGVGEFCRTVVAKMARITA
jgi:probable F420-dependent oxidoreductase